MRAAERRTRPAAKGEHKSPAASRGSGGEKRAASPAWPTPGRDPGIAEWRGWGAAGLGDPVSRKRPGEPAGSQCGRVCASWRVPGLPGPCEPGARAGLRGGRRAGGKGVPAHQVHRRSTLSARRAPEHRPVSPSETRRPSGASSRPSLPPQKKRGGSRPIKVGGTHHAGFFFSKEKTQASSSSAPPDALLRAPSPAPQLARG